MYRIDEHTKHRIVSLRESGVSVADICEELGITVRFDTLTVLSGQGIQASIYIHCIIYRNMEYLHLFAQYIFLLQRRTVYLWWKRWCDEGSLASHVSSGRRKKTTAENDRILIESVLVNRFVSVPTYATEFNVCPNTIRRRLRSVGLRHRIPARKPQLTERHKTLRLQFANKYLNYDFNKVIFVDEKTFTTNADGRVSLYRMDNTRYEERHVLPDRRSGRLSLGFWGWVSAAGPGELVEISTRLNASSYVEILRDVLIPTFRNVFGDETIFLLQDNSSIHNSRLVQAWIDEQDNIELIKLSPKSPDLNIIENVWGIMTQNWDSSQVKTVANLRQHVHELWDYYRGLDFCENAVKSMQNRLQNVIDAFGAYTKY